MSPWLETSLDNIGSPGFQINNNKTNLSVHLVISRSLRDAWEGGLDIIHRPGPTELGEGLGSRRSRVGSSHCSWSTAEAQGKWQQQAGQLKQSLVVQKRV